MSLYVFRNVAKYSSIDLNVCLHFISELWSLYDVNIAISLSWILYWETLNMMYQLWMENHWLGPTCVCGLTICDSSSFYVLFCLLMTSCFDANTSSGAIKVQMHTYIACALLNIINFVRWILHFVVWFDYVSQLYVIETSILCCRNIKGHIVKQYWSKKPRDYSLHS